MNIIKIMLRLEGLAIFIASVYLFYHLQGSWLFFTVFILTPDISMIGYLKDKKLGAITYNLVHNYLLALIIIATGFFTQNPILINAGLILAAHVGIDRFLGFGLKYPTSFKATHIQKV